MFFSSSKKDSGRVIAVVDIGSAQVSGAIVRLTKDGGIESVIAESSEKISYQGLPNFEHFWSETKKTIQILLKELKSKANKIEPEKVQIFLSSPFFQSRTKLIKIENPGVIKVTKNYLANLVKQSYDQNSFGSESIILEDKIMQTRLDGYLTTWPLDQRAREISLNHFLSWADKNLLINLRDLMKAEYPKASVIFNTFSFAIFNIFKDFLPDKDFILIDTGNEITDILIVKDNVLAEHFSFPKGKNFLLRSLTQKLNTVQAELETSLNLYVTEQANVQLRARLEPALKQVAPLWQADLKEVLARTIETTFLPENVYFVSDDPIDSLFAQFIEWADLGDVTLSNHKLNAVFVEKLLADGLRYLTGKTPPLTNSWLLAEVLFCAKVK